MSATWAPDAALVERAIARGLTVRESQVTYETPFTVHDVERDRERAWGETLADAEEAAKTMVEEEGGGLLEVHAPDGSWVSVVSLDEHGNVFVATGDVRRRWEGR